MKKPKNAKSEKFFFTRLENFNNEYFSSEFQEIQKRVYQQLVQQQKTTDNDLKLYEKFKKIVQEKKDKANGQRIFFDYKDIDKLELDYDLLFLYGAKNIGKTFATGKLVEEKLKEPGSKIFMLRNSKNEVDKGYSAQLEGDEWPFTISRSSGTLIRKPYRIPSRGVSPKFPGDLKQKEIKELKAAIKANPETDPDLCGYVTYLSGSGMTSFQGPSYKNLKCLLWDECNDLGDLNSSHIKRLLTFVVSLERNNKDFKVYMTGNLLRHETGAASNIFFDYFGIPYDCKLKYFTLDNGLKILYINPGRAGELYDGVDDQKFSTVFGKDMAEDLYSNQPLPFSSKVLNRHFFLTCCKPVLSFVFHQDEQLWIYYLGSYEREDSGTFYVMKIEKFCTAYNHRGYYPFSDNVAIVNQFGNIRYARKEDIGDAVDRIFKVEQIKRMFYADDSTCHMWLNKISERFKSKYSEQLAPGF